MPDRQGDFMQDVRRCGVNLDYWWPVAHERSFPATGLLGVRIGALELLVFRAPTGHYSVFEDACPHKRVRLSRFGEVVGSELMCSYHGWRFTAQGNGSLTPGFAGLEAKFCLKSYPVRRYGGWIWAFPGDPTRVEERALPIIPPATDPCYHPIPMEGPVHCHFSYMTENATDLFHAQLHKSQQPWANPVLLHLESDDRSVWALYEVEAPRLLAALIGQRGKNRIRVTYEYPYFHLASEDGAFYLFVVYVPTSSTSIWVHSTFYFRHVLGIPWILRLLHPLLDQGTFRQVFGQDRRAVEEEQRAYNLHQQDLSRETNPVSHAVRQVIRQQTLASSPLPEQIPG